MVSHLMNNSNFSSAINQANKNSSAISSKNESERNEKRVADSTPASSNSRVDEIKQALAEGSYKIDFRGSAEKMAQKLLGE
ncbi:MAG: flagellar biosynthesis anti-sigma factor FlgM [Helicobacter sp.]|nr:flagellar biosynthesis anti-sigma factor FlgM [Helicobacter sp.]